MEEQQLAVFIDFENIAISAEEVYGRCDLGLIIETAEKWGRCVIKRAYGDWTHFSRYSQVLFEHSIESIHLFHYGAQRRKNAADIQMVVDTLETVFIHPDVDVFVLATGDSDFSAMARKLREYGKLVIGIGLRQATSEVLVKSCDQFILYDNLIEPETRSMAYSQERGRQLLLDTMPNLVQQSETGEVLAARLKAAMLEQDPTFNELTLGFPQFKSFLEAQSDLVEMDTRGATGTELVVTLKPAAAGESLHDETSQYRRALIRADLRLLDPHARTEILQDLFHLLAEGPGEFTLEKALQQLKAQYDATNILRSRDEVQGVARLVKYADVLEPGPHSWELDSLTLKPELQAQSFVDRCESVYVMTLLEKNLPIEPNRVALLLFGTSDQSARVEQLARLARESVPERARTLHRTAAWDWPSPLKESPELRIALQDLEGYALDEGPSVERSAELNRAGLRTRTTDFEVARDYFLKSAKMMFELLHRGEPGASLLDLEWYLASYCAATAGASFFRYDYSQAAKYYLAFFALVIETEPVWDKVQKLVPPLLSFYFTIAANEHREILDVSPGRTHPARIAIALQDHSNPGVQERWLELAGDLARINPTLLRMVIQRLEALVKEEVDGAQEARDALSALVRREG